MSPHAAAVVAVVDRSNTRARSNNSRPSTKKLYEAMYGSAWPTSASKAGAVLTRVAARIAVRREFA